MKTIRPNESLFDLATLVELGAANPVFLFAALTLATGIAARIACRFL